MAGFLDLPIDVVVEKILPLVGFSDISALSRTCKLLRSHVEYYATHYAESRSGIREKLLCNDPGLLLTLEEARLMKRLKNSKADGLGHRLKILRLISSLDGRIRKSFTFPHEFPHFGNPNYIIKEVDKKLGREVVVLRMVCWLYIQMRFPSVPPGKYVMKVHCRLPKYDSPGLENKTELNVLKWKMTAGGSKELTLLAQSKFDTWVGWPGLKKVQGSTIRFCNAYVSLMEGGWCCIELGPFQNAETEEIFFEWKDIENGAWKSRLSWDFVEVCPYLMSASAKQVAKAAKSPPSH